MHAKFHRRRPSDLGALGFENVDTARTDGIGRTYIRTHGHLTGFRSHLGKMTNYTVIIKKIYDSDGRHEMRPCQQVQAWDAVTMTFDRLISKTHAVCVVLHEVNISTKSEVRAGH